MDIQNDLALQFNQTNGADHGAIPIKIPVSSTILQGFWRSPNGFKTSTKSKMHWIYQNYEILFCWIGLANTG